MKNFGAQSMFTELITVLVKKPQSFMSKVNLNKWNYTYPLDQDLINQNYNEFIKIIKKFGTKIIELKLENENDELCDSIFTHDPSIVTNEGTALLKGGAECGDAYLDLAGTTIIVEAAGDIGDHLDFICDGTYWYVSGHGTHDASFSVT